MATETWAQNTARRDPCFQPQKTEHACVEKHKITQVSTLSEVTASDPSSPSRSPSPPPRSKASPMSSSWSSRFSGYASPSSSRTCAVGQLGQLDGDWVLSLER